MLVLVGWTLGGWLCWWYLSLKSLSLVLWLSHVLNLEVAPHRSHPSGSLFRKHPLARTWWTTWCSPSLLRRDHFAHLRWLRMEQGNLPRKWAESEFGFMLTHYLPICLDSPNRSGLWKNLKFGVTKFKSTALFLWECGPIFTPYIFWDFMATKIKHLKTEQFVICCPEIYVHPCILNSKKNIKKSLWVRGQHRR